MKYKLGEVRSFGAVKTKVEYIERNKNRYRE